MSLDFVAFDVETANYDRGSICAVGWAVVHSGTIVDTGSVLCRPPEPVCWFSGFNIAIHGITAADVADQPAFGEIAPALIDSFGDLPVVAHNAAFDIGALREALSYSEKPWPRLAYGCTLVWSRRLLDLPSHRLPIVCERLGITLDHHHDAGDDARAAAQIAIALSALAEARSVEDLLAATYSRLGRLQPGEWVGCTMRPCNSSRPVPLANLEADPENPFYGQTVVFTGGLACMSRSVAWECVAQAGGTIGKGVTKSTSLLVIGDGFTGDTLDDFLTTRKAQQALHYRAKGQPIEFWSEIDFVQALTTTGVASLKLTSTPEQNSVTLS